MTHPKPDLDRRPEIEVRKRLDPQSVGRCNACMNAERTVASIRIGDHVTRLCNPCAGMLTKLLSGKW